MYPPCMVFMAQCDFFFLEHALKKGLYADDLFGTLSLLGAEIEDTE